MRKIRIICVLSFCLLLVLSMNANGYPNPFSADALNTAMMMDLHEHSPPPAQLNDVTVTIYCVPNATECSDAANNNKDAAVNTMIAMWSEDEAITINEMACLSSATLISKSKIQIAPATSDPPTAINQGTIAGLITPRTLESAMAVRNKEAALIAKDIVGQNSTTYGMVLLKSTFPASERAGPITHLVMVQTAQMFDPGPIALKVILIELGWMMEDAENPTKVKWVSNIGFSETATQYAKDIFGAWNVGGSSTPGTTFAAIIVNTVPGEQRYPNPFA